MFFHDCIKSSLAFFFFIFFFLFYKQTVFPSSFLCLGRTWCVNCDTCHYMTKIPWTTTQRQQWTQQRKTRHYLYDRNNKDFTLCVSVVCSLSVVQTLFFFFTRHQGFFFLLKILSNKNSISPPYFQCNYRAFKLEQQQNKLPKTDFQLLKLMVR